MSPQSKQGAADAPLTSAGSSAPKDPSPHAITGEIASSTPNQNRLNTRMRNLLTDHRSSPISSMVVAPSRTSNGISFRVVPLAPERTYPPGASGPDAAKPA